MIVIMMRKKMIKKERDREVEVIAAQPLSLAARSSRSRASAAFSAAIAESSFRQLMSIFRLY
ncbi:hypothetical protein [Intrasporangium calvum]|uniref:hypothetical protein n=1 Tax=Intrasporangium calvum TaxID=53358 RepID=UPI000DF61210|nr:hypothetical protein [Intrasporangium calvum]AXG12550.1 hypothetical protein DN585_03110 [Intrasporangium calvum]